MPLESVTRTEVKLMVLPKWMLEVPLMIVSADVPTWFAKIGVIMPVALMLMVGVIGPPKGS